MIFSFFTRWAGRDIYTHIYRYEYIYHPPHIGEGRCNTLHIAHGSHCWICISPSSALPSRHWRRSAENPSSTGTCGISDMLPGIFQSRGIEIYLNSVGQFCSSASKLTLHGSSLLRQGCPLDPSETPEKFGSHGTAARIFSSFSDQRASPLDSPSSAEK